MTVWLRTRDVAGQLQVAASTVMELAKRGEFQDVTISGEVWPGAVKVGGQWRIHEKALENFIRRARPALAAGLPPTDEPTPLRRSALSEKRQAAARRKAS